MPDAQQDSPATSPADAAAAGARVIDDAVTRAESAMDAALTRMRMPANLVDAARYAALGPGKRVRPRLVFASCLAAQPEGAGETWTDDGPPALAVAAAAAVELVHAFSLVHDDLPALDDDDVRRGRPTTHKQFGEAMGLLAGDALLTLAFRVLLESASEGSDPQRLAALRIAGVLSRATTDMISGQVLDTLGGGPGWDDADAERRLREVHAGKTAALIIASCVMGGMAAGRADGSDELAALAAFGEATGLMFQITDDLIDVAWSAERAGKATGKDVEAGKLTFPSVLGVEASRAEVERLLARALVAADRLPGDAGPLREIATAVAQRTR